MYTQTVTPAPLATQDVAYILCIDSAIVLYLQVRVTLSCLFNYAHEECPLSEGLGPGDAAPWCYFLLAASE